MITRVVQEGNVGRVGWGNYGGSVAINPLDLLYIDGSGNVQPAVQQADQGTVKSNQLLFAQNFIGLAGAGKLSTDPADSNFPVITDAIVDANCASATFATGDKVAVAENGGVNGILSDTVIGVTDPTVMIGQIVKPGTTVTLGRCRLKSDLLHGSRGGFVRFGEIVQTVAVAAFTGSSTTCFLDLTDKLPAGAVVLGWTFNCTGAFAGDTTATLAVGISGTPNKFSADTAQSVFTTGKRGAASTAATSFQLTEIAPRLTVTSSTAGSAVISNGGGAGVIRIKYMVFDK